MAENEVKPIEIPVTANTTKAEKELKRLFEAVEKNRTINLTYKSTAKNFKEITDIITSLQSRLKQLQDTKSGNVFSSMFGGLSERSAISKSLTEFMKIQEELSKNLTSQYIKEGKRLSELINAKKQNVKVSSQTATAENKVTKEIEKNTIALAKNTAEVEESEDANEKKEKQLTFLARTWNDITEGLGKRISIFASYKTISLITNALSDSARAVVDLQAEFANIQAITAATDGAMLSLKDTIFQVANNSKFSTEELAKTTVVLGQAGYSASEIEKLLDSVSKLAAATGTDLATSVNVATSALTVWNLEASQMSRVADVLTTAVNETKAEIGTIANGIQYAGAMFSDLGVSLEESVALFSAVTNAGLKARSVVGTGSRALVTELITPSTKLETVLKRLNLTLDDIDVRSLGITKVLENLKNAGFGAEEAFEALDRRAATFYSAASSQIEVMKNLNIEFLRQGATNKANEKQMNTLAAQTQRFRNIVVETTKNAVEPFLRASTVLFSTINDFLSSGVMKLLIEYVAKFGLVFQTVKLVERIKEFNVFSRVIDKTRSVVSLLSTEVKVLSSNLSKAEIGSSKLTKSLKFMVGVFRTLKTVVMAFSKTLIPLIAIEGFTKLMEWSGKTEKALEDSENKVNSHESAITSLNDAYEDLINKSDLYKDGSQELYWKIAQLNEQFSKENNLLLKQVDTYEQLIDAVRTLKYEEEQKQAKELMNSAKLRGENLSPTFFGPKSPFTVFGANDDSKVIREALSIFAKTDEDKKRIMFSLLNDWEQTLYSYLLKATDEDIKKFNLFIKEHGEKKSPRWQFSTDYKKQADYLSNILSESLTGKSESEKALAILKSSSKGLSEEYSKFVNSIINRTEAIEKSYKEEAKNMMNADELDVEGIVELSATTNEGLKSLLEEVKNKIQQEFESNPELKETPNEYIKELQSLEGIIQKQINDLTKDVNKDVEEYVTKAVERTKTIWQNTVRLMGLGFYGEKDIGIINQIYGNFMRMLGLEESIKLSKVKGDDAISKQKRAEILEKTKSDKDFTFGQLAEGMDKVTDRTEKFKTKIDSLKESFNNIGTIADSKRQNVRARLGLNEQEGKVSAMERMGGSPLELYEEQIKLERLEMEYNKENLRIEQETLSALQSKKAEVDGTVSSLELEVKRLTKLKEDYSGVESKARDWEKANKDLTLRQGELTSALSTQRQITNEILKSEQEIAKLKGEQDIYNSYGGKTPTESNATMGFSGGLKKYIDEYTDSMKDFNNEARFVYGTIDSFTSEFTNFTQSIFNGTESVKDSFKSMASSILKTMADLIVEMTIKAAIIQSLTKLMGFFAPSSETSQLGDINGMAGVDYSRVAQGGSVNGPVQNRDSVPALLMPGEYVLKKSTAKALGSDFLNSLNNNASEALSSLSGGTIIQQSEPSVVNVWVVSDKEQAQMGPNDIIATITKDIRTGGTTKKLIQSVMAGRRA